MWHGHLTERRSSVDEQASAGNQDVAKSLERERPGP
jgi:hypothetical protein